MPEKYILLADAEKQAAEVFRAALGEEWEVTHVTNGNAAVDELKKRTYQVLVVDLDLPGLDGEHLLNRIRSKYPGTIRFIATAEAEGERVVKHLLGAHQFLTKPYDPHTLKSSIEQALALDYWIDNEGVRKLIARVRSFPTVPSLYLEVVEALRSPNVTTEQVGAIIAKDMAIMTKLLQVLNSGYFGLSRKITDPSEAVGMLGFRTVKSMVIGVKLLGFYDRFKPVHFSVDRLWQHSTDVAHMARRLALEQTGQRDLAEDAFTAGLMHDVGKVVLAGNFDEQYHGACCLAQKQQLPLWEVEREIFGASHGEIGAYLLGLWGLPIELLEAVALHHFPSRSTHREFSPLTAVHIADVLVHEANAQDLDLVPNVDGPYVSHLGLLQRLIEWRNPDGNGDEQETEVPNEPTPASVPVPAFEPVPAYAPASIAEPVPAAATRSFMPRKLWFLAGGIAVAVLLIVGLGQKLRVVKPEPTQIRARETSTNSRAETVAGKPSTPAIRDTTDTKPVLTNLPAGAVASESPSPGRVPIASPTPDLAARTNMPVGPEISAVPSAKSSLDQPTSPTAPEFPTVKLQGITFSADHPSVIINGRTLRLNERLGEVRVVEIGRTYVTLESGAQRKTLTLK